jgi:hypothetical protein
MHKSAIYDTVDCPESPENAVVLIMDFWFSQDLTRKFSSANLPEYKVKPVLNSTDFTKIHKVQAAFTRVLY